jgi:hypothetical protein
MTAKGNRKQTAVEPYVKKLRDLILRGHIDLYTWAHQLMGKVIQRKK